LRPHYNSRRITKERYKEVMKKAVKKVLAGGGPSQEPGEVFMDEKRLKAIELLVKKYVEMPAQ
jgi:hypothetical protein